MKTDQKCQMAIKFTNHSQLNILFNSTLRRAAHYENACYKKEVPQRLGITKSIHRKSKQAGRRCSTLAVSLKRKAWTPDGASETQ